MKPEELKDLKFGDWVTYRGSGPEGVVVGRFVCRSQSPLPKYRIWDGGRAARHVAQDRILSSHGTDRAAAEHACECWKKVGKWYTVKGTVQGDGVYLVDEYFPGRDEFIISHEGLQWNRSYRNQGFVMGKSFFDTRAEAEAALLQSQGSKCNECEGTAKLPGPGADNRLIDCPWCDGTGEQAKAALKAQPTNPPQKRFFCEHCKDGANLVGSFETGGGHCIHCGWDDPYYGTDAALEPQPAGVKKMQDVYGGEMPKVAASDSTKPLISKQNQEALDILTKWLATPDDLGKEWWDDFEAFTKKHRMNLRTPEPGKPIERWSGREPDCQASYTRTEGPLAEERAFKADTAAYRFSELQLWRCGFNRGRGYQEEKDGDETDKVYVEMLRKIQWATGNGVKAERERILGLLETVWADVLQRGNGVECYGSFFKGELRREIEEGK